jgi:hypothetical protein
MKWQTSIFAFCMLLGVVERSDARVPTTSPADYRVDGVSLRESTYLGSSALELEMPPVAYQDPSKERLTDRTYMAWLPIDFRDGTIDVDIASNLAPDAPSYARGFAGISFRIGPDMRFENIYLRPVNSTVDDQVRRNHTV